MRPYIGYTKFEAFRLHEHLILRLILNLILRPILKQVQDDKKVRYYEATRFVIPAAEPESIKPIRS